MPIVVVPLRSGVESRRGVLGLNPHQLAVIAMIDDLALVLCGEKLRGNRYILGRYLVQECSIGTASNRRAARFVTLFAPHRGNCGGWKMGSQEQKRRPLLPPGLAATGASYTKCHGCSRAFELFILRLSTFNCHPNGWRSLALSGAQIAKARQASPP